MSQTATWPIRPGGAVLMSHRWHELRERFDGWGGAALVILGLGLLIVGSKVQAIRPREAKLLALAAPLVPLALSFFATRDAPTRLRVPVSVVALAVAVISEIVLIQALIPPHPFAEVDLVRDGPGAAVRLPADGDAFDVEVHAALGVASGQGRGGYAIELERAGTVERLRGHVEQKVQRGRRVRRMGPMTTITAHQTETFRRSIAGAGDVAVRLADVDGNIDPNVHVLFRPLPVGAHFAPQALIVLAVIALGVETWARRCSIMPGLFAPVAFVAVFAVETARELNRDDPLATVMGVGLMAAIAALFAWGIGWLAGRLATGRPAGGDPLVG